MNTPRHRPMNPRCLRLITLLLLLFSLPSAFATPTTPTSDFTDNQDGTVTHKTTGLTWMRCAMGQTWTGSVCTGTATTYTYDAAKKLSYDFAGNSDWRLPNIAELQTIVERGTINPAIIVRCLIIHRLGHFGLLRPMWLVPVTLGMSISLAAMLVTTIGATFSLCG